MQQSSLHQQSGESITRCLFVGLDGGRGELCYAPSLSWGCFHVQLPQRRYDLTSLDCFIRCCITELTPHFSTDQDSPVHYSGPFERNWTWRALWRARWAVRAECWAAAGRWGELNCHRM
ncbi:hypothetical protein Mapa_016607 [Marchantia paleacea]|nr:hypothetical protein Mapa_016607 [Marchantia paleacea]